MDMIERRKAQNLVASRPEPRAVTPSIRSFAQAIDRQRAGVERVPLLDGARPDLAAAMAALDEAEVSAIACALDDPESELPRFAAAASAVSVPVLRADLVLEEFQVYQSRAAGADALLLVAAAVGPALDRIASAARSTHMTTCVLCAEPAQIAQAIAARADVIALPAGADGALREDLLSAVPRRALVLAVPGGVALAPTANLRGRADALLDRALGAAPDPAAAFRAALASDGER